MSFQDARIQKLESWPIPRLLWHFSLPAVLAMIVNALYNVVDRIFLGMVSGSAIAAVYVTYPMALLIMAMDMWIGVGGATLASIRLGQGQKDEAEGVLANAFTLLVLAALVTMGLMWVFLEPLLTLFGASPSLLSDAAAYQRIIILGIPMQVLGFGLNNFIRAEGNPRMAMVTMLIGAVANIILDALFILGFGWGVQGAALATILAQALAGIVVIGYFVSGHATLRLRLSQLGLKIKRVRRILAVGFPSFGMQVAASSVIVVFNHQINIYGGDMGIAIMGVCQSISTLCFMPMFGINQGLQPIIGYHHGAQKTDRLKETLYLAIKVGVVYSLIASVIVLGFPGQLLHLFVQEPSAYAALYDMGVEAIRLYFITLPILAYPIIGSTYFQATGQAVLASFLSLSRQLILLIPILLILARLFGMTGIWLAYPVSDVIATIIVAFFLTRAMAKLDQSPKKP